MLSTARPTPLRLAGFLALTLGGLLVGLGSVLTWATVKLPGDVKGILDSPFHGTDVWEGKLTLAFGVAILVGMIAMRLAYTKAARKALATAILALGLLATALAAADIARAKTRFTDRAALERIAHALAPQVGQPFGRVLAQLQTMLAKTQHVSVGIGLVLVLVGGLLAAAGGGLSLAWVGRQRLAHHEAEQDEPAAPDAPA